MEWTNLSQTAEPEAAGFTADGTLKPGIHLLTLSELKKIVFINERRQVMWYRFIAFLAWPIFIRQFANIYVAGSFVSTKGNPSDIDVILETRTRYGPESFAAVERFFMVGLDRIHAFYGVDVHFWMAGAPSGFSDYRSFFQYTRPARKPADLDRVGIVRLAPESLTIEELSRHFTPFLPDNRLAYFPHEICIPEGHS